MTRHLLALTLLLASSTSLTFSKGDDTPESITSGVFIEVPTHTDVEEKNISPVELPTEMAIDTIYGSVTVTEPVLIELLHHPAMTRLRDIDQHGPSTYYLNYPTFSRYTHSVGVFVLLRKFGANLKEQIAGLLHDASHTVFSHLADRFFKTGNEYAYQDRIHEWHLKKMGVDKVLGKYGMEVADVIPEDYDAVKTKPPVLCADYLEYNLRTGLVFDRITQDDIDQVMQDTRLVDGTWFFTTQKSARIFADQAVHFVEYFWGSAWNTAHHYWVVSALNVLVARNLVSFADIHFGGDKKVVDLLEGSSDKHIQEMLKKCRTPKKYFKVVSSAADHDLTEHPKCRAINPLVLQEDGKKILLTELDAEFKKAYHDVKHYCQRGIKLKFVEPASTPSS